jgi:heme oxygenase
MSLKELTADKHQQAEDTLFMKAVFAKTLPFDLWVDFTYQKQLWYKEIEHAAREAGLLNALPGIARAHLIMDDYQSMDKPIGSYNTYRELTKDYASYIRSLDDPKRIMAHLYTWHMGDLFGGQIIKKQVAHISSGKFYDFENADAMKMAIRQTLTDDLGDEARIAFEFAIAMMKDLYNGE